MRSSCREGAPHAPPESRHREARPRPGLAAALSGTLIGGPVTAQDDHVVMMSTQLAPEAEAQKMRDSHWPATTATSSSWT